jgi:hypothetical protein
MVDEAREVTDRIEKANERTAELLRQQEELIAKQMLGGRADAGQVQKPKEETPEEYAKRIIGGKL